MMAQPSAVESRNSHERPRNAGGSDYEESHCFFLLARSDAAGIGELVRPD
jgi:hypothetical protein